MEKVIINGSKVDRTYFEDPSKRDDLFKMSFINDWVRLDKDSSLEDVLVIKDKVSSMLARVKAIESDGFVFDANLTENKCFAVFKELLAVYMHEDFDPVEYTKLVSNKNSSKIFKWMYNRCMLELYISMTISVLHLECELKDLLGESDYDQDYVNMLRDEIANLKTLSSELYAKVDSSIRVSLKRKNLTFSENRYTGFDTEFKTLGIGENSLVSVQLSVNTRTLVRIPIRGDYVYSRVGSTDGKFYEINDYNPFINNEKYLSDINKLIKYYRWLRYGNHDFMVEVLIRKLVASGIPNVACDDCIVFDFGRTGINQWIKHVDGVGVGLNDIVRVSNAISAKALDSEYIRIATLIKNLLSDDKEVKYDQPLKELPNNFENRTTKEEYTKILGLVEERVSDGFVMDSKTSEEFDKMLGRPVNRDSDVTRDADKVLHGDASSSNTTIITDDNNNIINIVPNNGNDSANIVVNDNSVNTKSTSVGLLNPLEVPPVEGDVVEWTRITSSGVSLRLGRNKRNYIIGHYNAADLSMLKDFELFKEELDIVNGSFISLKAPMIVDNIKVYFRDTILLTAGGASLSSLGEALGYPKMELAHGVITRMDELAVYDWGLFKEYALRDTVIPLAHAIFFEDFNLTLGKVNVPITVSGMSETVIKDYWRRSGYKGYQVHPEYLIGDTNKIMTPKGINAVGLVAKKLPMFLGNYKGGRNESFAYGIDRDTYWYDYDLEGAYTTVMSLMGNPLYSKIRELRFDEFKRMSRRDLLYSYTIIDVSFTFPEDTKYPSIPVQVDKNTTVYPLKGTAILTGSEYITAEQQGCRLHVKEIVTVPFEEYKENKARVTLEDGRKRFVENKQAKDLLEKELIWFITLKDKLGICLDRRDAQDGKTDIVLENMMSEIHGSVLGTDQWIKHSENFNWNLLRNDPRTRDVSEISGDAGEWRVGWKWVDCIDSKERLKYTWFVYDECEKAIKRLEVVLKGLTGLDVTYKSKGDIYKFKTPNILGRSNFIGVDPSKVIKGKLGTSDKVYMNMPFKDVVKYLQSERRKHPKKSLLNLLYKLLGNGGYGLTARGLSGDGTFDSRTGTVQRMSCGELSNPLISSWITAFIRSVLGEMLHCVDKLGGKVISVTTDGFITDIPDLEAKLLKYYTDEARKDFSEVLKRLVDEKGDKIRKTGDLKRIQRLEQEKGVPIKEEFISLFEEFKASREFLTDTKGAPALDIKNKGKGLCSWTVRGQLGDESAISAITGFQKSGIETDNLFAEVAKAIKSEDKTIHFMFSSLRNGLSIFKHGGHVTKTYRDQVFRLQYDNRRQVIKPEGLKYRNIVLRDGHINKVIDYDNTMLYTKPFVNIDEARCYRAIIDTVKTSTYSKASSVNKGSGYKSYVEIALRSFIRAFYNNEAGLDSRSFKYYRNFIEWYEVLDMDNKPRLNANSLALVKARGKFLANTVPRTSETERFVFCVKETFKDFNEELFFELTPQQRVDKDKRLAK